MKNHYILITLLFLLTGFLKGFAQPQYEMSNLVVDDCEGFLLDSEMGDFGGYYDHNEDYTFSICVPGADQIVMNFLSFCLEADFDFLSVYDGPDTTSNSTLLGIFTGEEDPPVLIATSGCMTIHFISDPNVACHGWVGHWTTEFDIPEPPEILPIANLPCESNTLSITFDEPVPCAAITPDAFAISGAQSPTVVSATPLNCVNGMTTMVDLVFDPPIDFSGNYQIRFTQIIGVCETDFVVQSLGNFSVVNCPLNVELSIDEEISLCVGDSITIFAEVSGGNPNTYVYTWMPEPSNTDTLNVAPMGPTTYYINVTDGSGASADDSITIIPNPIPILSIGDTAICQSDDPFTITAIPSGGFFNGQGFEDEENGFYDPDLVTDLPDVITYEDPNGCIVEINVDIIPLDIGTEDASCPGPAAAPFIVSGGLPEGGTWSGMFINPDGLFTPPDSIDSFLVTYTHPNGCSGSKLINVDSISLPDLDTLCQSVEPFEINITPFGGIWSGPGIIDSDTGEFDPDEAGPGDHQLLYTINGCEDSISIFIKEINARGNLVACPEQDPFILPGNWQPSTGGIWYGQGIIDSLTGFYDPSLLPSGFNDVVTFAVNGCTDERTVYIRQTNVEENEPFQFCGDDDELVLDDDNLGLVPRNGVWTGPGVTLVEDDDNDYYVFNSLFAGEGSFTLYYERNTCVDSIQVNVAPIPTITPVSLCEEDAAVILEASPSEGNWFGPGIIDENQGFFDPGDAGVGFHTISFESDEGCYAETIMEVSEFLEASLGEIDNYFCYKDSVITLDLMPTGGILYIDSLEANTLNPADLGPGFHSLRYEVGMGGCANSESTLIEVGEPITLDLPFDTDSVCFGLNVPITATASGGSSLNNFTYTWNNDLGFGQTQYVIATSTTTYTVSAEDGCSDPALSSLTLYVHRPINTDFSTGPRVCFDDTTSATIMAFPGDSEDYTYTWDSDPPTDGPTIESYPTTYTVEILDNTTGCIVEEEISLPGYPLIKANFGISPNEECISIFDSRVEILDFSVGGGDGYWDFGDGSPQVPYTEGVNIAHTYPDTGQYTVSLFIENEGGCISEFQLPVCIKADYRIFAPNAFTPNGDGTNDFYHLVGTGIESIDWQIYNRYGELVFQGDSLEEGWDGKFKGKRVTSGVYQLIASYTTIHGYEDVIKSFVTVLY